MTLFEMGRSEEGSRIGKGWWLRARNPDPDGLISSMILAMASICARDLRECREGQAGEGTRAMRGSVRWILAVVAVLALCVMCGCKVGASAGSDGSGNGAIPANSIAGTVTFEGNPLAGVTMTLLMTSDNATAQVATTDADGHYSFTGIAATGDVPGEYQIWAQATGYRFDPSLSGEAVGSGAKVERPETAGRLEGNGVADIGVDFTVIDYVSRPYKPLAGANFAAYDGTNPRVSRAATGQAASDAAGDAVR